MKYEDKKTKRGLLSLMWMPNGMVACFDEKEEQVPEYQGKASEIFAKLLVDSILESVSMQKPKESTE